MPGSVDRMSAVPAETSVAAASDLSGRVAVLTGAASGIGRATAHVLAGAGATVVLGDIDEAGEATVAKEAAARGGRAQAVRTDVTSRADVDGLERAATDYGRAAPLERVGLPADVAWTILYLVSDAATFVTGPIIRPNGGTAMPW